MNRIPSTRVLSAAVVGGASVALTLPFFGMVSNLGNESSIGEHELLFGLMVAVVFSGLYGVLAAVLLGVPALWLLQELEKLTTPYVVVVGGATGLVVASCVGRDSSLGSTLLLSSALVGVIAGSIVAKLLRLPLRYFR